jgi:hypothetical protein
VTGEEIILILAKYVRINECGEMKPNSERGEEEKEILVEK